MYIDTMYACMLSRFSHVQLFGFLWTISHQTPLPMGLSKQEYWSGLTCNLRIEPESPGLLHCRRILYLLSHQGSPIDSVPTKKVTCLRFIHPEYHTTLILSPTLLLCC